MTQMADPPQAAKIWRDGSQPEGQQWTLEWLPPSAPPDSEPSVQRFETSGGAYRRAREIGWNIGLKQGRPA